MKRERLPYGVRRDGSRYTTKCNHNPRQPQLDLRNPPHAGMPHPIVAFCDRAAAFYDDPRNFQTLKRCLKNETRVVRSQRREAICLLLQELGMHTDLATWRIRDFINGRERGRAVAQYAKATGLKRRRVERALHDLVEAGYLLYVWDEGKKPKAVAAISDYRDRLYYGQKRIEKKTEGGNVEYEALSAVREWTARAFIDAELLDDFKGPRDAARALLKKEAAAAQKATEAAAADERLRARSEVRRRARISTAPQQPPEADEKSVHQLAAAILADQPQLGLAGAVVEARRRLGTGPPE